ARHRQLPLRHHPGRLLARDLDAPHERHLRRRHHLAVRTLLDRGEQWLPDDDPLRHRLLDRDRDHDPLQYLEHRLHHCGQRLQYPRWLLCREWHVPFYERFELLHEFRRINLSHDGYESWHRHHHAVLDALGFDKRPAIWSLAALYRRFNDE